MTALLEAIPDLVVVEVHEPSAPRTCSRGHHPNDSNPPCERLPEWEALCMGCGHVFLRCQPHYEDHCRVVQFWGGLGDSDAASGQCQICAQCGTPTYLDQYGRI